MECITATYQVPYQISKAQARFSGNKSQKVIYPDGFEGNPQKIILSKKFVN
jgi:hypothetical protein